VPGFAKSQKQNLTQTGADLYPSTSTKHMKFFYVYVLKSLVKNFVYIGYTENLRNRLAEHNLHNFILLKLSL